MPYASPEDKKKWYERNKDKIAVKKRQYQEDNSWACAARQLAWARKNPEKIKLSQKKMYERGDALITNKKLSGCVICGEKRLPCLDLHHSDPSTKTERQIRKRLREDRLLAELEKCVVMCANCHRLYHWESQSGQWRKEDEVK